MKYFFVYYKKLLILMSNIKKMRNFKFLRGEEKELISQDEYNRRRDLMASQQNNTSQHIFDDQSYRIEYYRQLYLLEKQQHENLKKNKQKKLLQLTINFVDKVYKKVDGFFMISKSGKFYDYLLAIILSALFGHIIISTIINYFSMNN